MKKLSIVKMRKPKGYKKLKLSFKSIKGAEDYVSFLRNDFLSEKSKLLGYPNISNRKKKLLFFTKPKKYVLTKVGSSYTLWEEL